MTRNMTIIALAAAFSATAVLAQTEIDANGDGMLSMDELHAVYPDMTEIDFMEADSDADGLVSEEELAAAREAGVIPEEQG